jgi:hypothetical protein
MQHHETFDVIKCAIRAKICPRCHQRPPGSEALGPHQPRVCEPRCPVFLNLSRIVEIATGNSGESYERAVKSLICEPCTLAPSSGEFCSEYLTRTCPLSCYARDVLGLVEQITAGTQRNIEGKTRIRE